MVFETGSRRKIWELTGGWHCAVVGTCLTLADLRSLARKLAVKTRPGYSSDYQLHGFFAQEAGSSGKPGKMLNKLLDKRHAVAIRKARNIRCVEKLGEYWNSALETGDIPGPYWAILSHPAATQSLSESMFADVHMLSHLVGASNRADIRRLQDYENEINVLEDKLSKQQRHQKQRLDAKEREIADIREKLRLHLAQSSKSEDQISVIETHLGEDVFVKENDVLRAKISKSDMHVTMLQKRNVELATIAQTLRAENALLEQTFLNDLSIDEGNCRFDLNGRCLLYVGGRQNTVPKLRSLVSDWNGSFRHHDGGLERSIDELASAIVKADVVIFPTDCVSHSAANKIKRLCRQTMKPYMPLRSSGVASFVDGVRNGLESDGGTVQNF